jgi:hypothetical protein
MTPRPAEVFRIEVRRSRSYSVRLLRVRCPYGMHTHTHGGGDPDRSIVLGERSAHCRLGPDYALSLSEDLDFDARGNAVERY